MDRLIFQSDGEVEAFIEMMEDMIEGSHEATCDPDLSEEDRSEASLSLMYARRFLKRIAPEHPIFDEKIESGVKYDWEAFWESQCDDEDAEEAGDEQAGEAPASSGTLTVTQEVTRD